MMRAQTGKGSMKIRKRVYLFLCLVDAAVGSLDGDCVG
jgi:hypothetical protein